MTDLTAKLHAKPEPEVRPMPKARIGLQGRSVPAALGAPGRRLHPHDSEGQEREHP
jgi:hypothetical protein